MKTLSLSSVSLRLRINRTVLRGILVGMGIHPPTGARADGGVPPRLLTLSQIRLIRKHLAAYRRVK